MNLFSLYNASSVSRIGERRIANHVVDCDRRIALYDRRARNEARKVEESKAAFEAAQSHLRLSLYGLAASIAFAALILT